MHHPCPGGFFGNQRFELGPCRYGISQPLGDVRRQLLMSYDAVERESSV